MSVLSLVGTLPRNADQKPDNTLYSINMNIGRGNCKWFSLCLTLKRCAKKNNVNITDSWSPNLIELQEERKPVIRSFQKAGDLVWLNNNCMHWVQLVGW